MLENGSGRIRLIGKPLKAARLITGIIIGALGMENPNRDVEVVDICDAGLAPPLLWIRHRISALRSRLELNGSTESKPSDDWIAAISGLNVESLLPSEAQIQMLVEYLAPRDLDSAPADLPRK